MSVTVPLGKYCKRTKNASAVMDSWMNSSGHRANILNSNFIGMAVGVVEHDGTKYWVQIFIYGKVCHLHGVSRISIVISD